MKELTENDSTEIYQMELHETAYYNNNWEILRVPGGWIYTQYQFDDSIDTVNTSTFVPFNNEFQESLNTKKK